MSATCNAAPIFLIRIVEREPDQAGAGRHKIASRLLAEFEDAFDHVLFGLLENTRAQALIDEHANFLFRYDGLLRLANAECRHEEIARDIEQIHQRGKKLRQAVHRTGECGGNAFGIVQRDALRHKFTNDDRKVSDGSDHDRQRDGISVILKGGDFFQRSSKPV